MGLAITCTILALIAIAANIGAQDLVIRSYNGTIDFLFSVAVGTGVGLVAKDVLDKLYIFRFCVRNVTHDVGTYALYTLMGLAMTVIFSGLDFGFHYLFETNEMRYLGGVIGPVIGYLIKYHLDKHYVFRTEGV